MKNIGQLLHILLFVLVSVGVAYGGDAPQLSYEPQDILMLIVYILLAISISFMCSIAESVLLCITPSFIESIRAENENLGNLLRQLRIEKVDQSFAAILSLNTIAHTAGAVMAGAQAELIFGSTWIGLFSAFMTLAILFLSEIIPKTIGTVYWKKLAGTTAVAIKVMIYVLYPFVWLSEKLTKRIGQSSDTDVMSRDEMIAMAEIGKKQGFVEQHEFRVFNNLFRLNRLNAADIMTPRVVISALPQSISVREALKTDEIGTFSRLPLFDQDIDNITGFVLKDQILLLAARGKMDTRMESLKREIPVIPETLPLSRLLDDMLKLRQQIAVVIDEYGGTAGIVTMEDAIETLLGIEIKDEMDNVEDMRHLARQKWRARIKELGVDIDETIA